MPPRLAVVFGTRPEAIKLAPVVEELRRRGVEPTIISTGQHTSLLRGTPAESTMVPHVSLHLTSDNDPLAYAERCRIALREKWRDTAWPELVVVQGDTASAYAGAEAAYSAGIPVAHIEAGIRSGDLKDPWPEEAFRVWIDEIAEYAFCATEGNGANLEGEPQLQRAARAGQIVKRTVWVTGNPGIDALYAHTQPFEFPPEDVVVITLHRRESFGEPLKRIIEGLRQSATLHKNLAFWWPMHPNPKVREAIMGRLGPTNLHQYGPTEPNPFAWQLSRSRAVITDSGGVQEEAAALGIPCIVAREKTDRPESVEAGLAKVVGRTEQGILDGLDWALGFANRPDPSHCFGDGHASPRIVTHLLEAL